MVYARGVMESPVGSLDQIIVSYVTVVGGNLLGLSGSVGSEVGAGDALLARFRRFDLLFRLIANSLVIENR